MLQKSVFEPIWLYSSKGAYLDGKEASYNRDHREVL